MKNVLIVENQNRSLQRVNENVGTKEQYVLGGTFTEFYKKNRNERIYTAEKFLPCLEELQGRMQSLGAVYGEFDHPDVFDTSLARASHVIKEIRYVKESETIQGRIKLLGTHWGKEAKALMDDDCPLFVSSRAAGITESDGSVTLKKLFTYDIVADPGFSSARMESINESVGYSSDTNFRIYEMSDESKINELFTMNKDNVTKEQLSDYSKYLVNEIASTKKTVKSAIKKGNLETKKLEQLLEYYDDLMESQNKIGKYLNYLSEKFNVVIKENKELKDNQKKIIEHNDYLAENLEKSIDYSEYLAENLDKSIDYSEYLAESVDKSIDYSEYLAESLDKSIDYSEYLAESLDKSIDYSEYLAENVDNNIAYSEYLAENLEGNIAYSEYIAENLDDNIAYADYIAENLDKSISYSKMVVEKLNTSSDKLFEGIENEEDRKIPTPEESGFDVVPEDEYDEIGDELADDLVDADMEDIEGEDCRVICGEEEDLGDEHEHEVGDLEDTPDIDMENEEEEGEMVEESVDGGCDCDGDCDDCEDCENEEEENEDENLSDQIDTLIEEAKKRKASETQEHHFLKFLNKAQVDSFYGLEPADQEKVTVYINEKNDYFCDSDVLKLIKEALEIKNESMDEKLIRLMPEQIKPMWGKMNEQEKISILSQSRLYPELNEQKIEHFWLTRNIKKNESTKKLIESDETLIQEDKLSDKAMVAIMERFKNL